MAYMSNSKIILELKLPKKEISIGPTLLKADNTTEQVIFSVY
jgi:hypothetical protein